MLPTFSARRLYFPILFGMYFNDMASTSDHVLLVIHVDDTAIIATSRKPVLLISCLEAYTGCNRRNGPDFGRMFLMLNYTDITQNTYIQS